jgi:hypothetical protein
MWLELISLLVGVITSVFQIQVFGLEFAGNFVAFFAATAFYFVGLITDKILAKKYGVQSRPNVIGSLWWSWWCLGGFLAFIFQIGLTPILKGVWYQGVTAFVSGLLVAGIIVVLFLVVKNQITNHYYRRPRQLR